MGHVRLLVRALFLLATCLSAMAMADPATAVSFGGDRSYGVGDRPYSVAAADFNGDAVPDLVVPNANVDTVSVMLGKGDGTFAPPVNYSTGDYPRTVAAADFTGDGIVDLAVANKSSDNVSILVGNGDGSFKAAVSYGAGDGPRTVITRDFDGDGRADLAVVNRFSGDVSVLLGRGDGTFGTATSYKTGARAYDVATADFNGDGKPDLAVVNTDADNVSVLLGIGDGTFEAAVNYGVGDSPFALTIADFNGDAKTDLAVGNLLSKNVSILPGRGDGTFGAPTSHGAGTFVFDVETDDFDGDGRPDLAVANNPYAIKDFRGYSGGAALLLNNGDGSFRESANYGVGNGPVAVETGDFDGDAKPDLAITNINSNNVTVLLQGNANLTLTGSRSLLTYPETTTLSGRLAAGDGTPLAGKRVILEWRPWAGDPAKGPFIPVANQPRDASGKIIGVPTDSNGFFSLAGVRPRWTTDYRARFVGGGSNRPVTSPLSVVRLKALVTLNVAGTDLKLGGTRTVSGGVFPEHKDMSVRLTIRRNGKPYATKMVPLVDSRFSLRFKPRAVGGYSVVASFPDHPPGHLGNVSGPKRFRVVR